jgi:hypothetical protein
VAWWATLEITLVWAALVSNSQNSFGVLALSLTYGLLVRARRRNPAPPRWAPSYLGPLEEKLKSELRLVAPRDFAARLRPEPAPAELDKDLAAPAPAGFRQRLMERLRQSGQEEP